MVRPIFIAEAKTTMMQLLSQRNKLYATKMAISYIKQTICEWYRSLLTHADILEFF